MKFSQNVFFILIVCFLAQIQTGTLVVQFFKSYNQIISLNLCGQMSTKSNCRNNNDCDVACLVYKGYSTDDVSLTPVYHYQYSDLKLYQTISSSALYNGSGIYKIIKGNYTDNACYYGFVDNSCESGYVRLKQAERTLFGVTVYYQCCITSTYLNLPTNEFDKMVARVYQCHLSLSLVFIFIFMIYLF